MSAFDGGGGRSFPDSTSSLVVRGPGLGQMSAVARTDDANQHAAATGAEDNAAAAAALSASAPLGSSKAEEEEAAARARIRKLQHARAHLAQMLLLLDPTSASALPPSSLSSQPLVVEASGPGLSQLLPLLLNPVLQPFEQQQQRAAAAAATVAALRHLGPTPNLPSSAEGPAARLASAIRSGMQKAGDLARLVGTATAPASTAPPPGQSPVLAAESSPTKAISSASAPAALALALTPALELASSCLRESLASSDEKASTKDDQSPPTTNAVLMLRKRKREAQDSQRAARRQRMEAVSQMIDNSTGASTISPSGLAGTNSRTGVTSEPRYLRSLRFPAPAIATRSGDTDLLGAHSLRAYLAAVQAHPRWKQPRLAAHHPHSLPGTTTLNTGGDQLASLGPFVAAGRVISLRVHTLPFSKHLRGLTSPLASTTSSTHATKSAESSTRQTSAADSSSAVILVEIPGVLQALLTLGIRTFSTSEQDPSHQATTAQPSCGSAEEEVVLVHANIRSSLEMQSTIAQKGRISSLAAAQGDAHLPSTSPLHRALSADLMAFVARERARRQRQRRRRSAGRRRAQDTLESSDNKSGFNNAVDIDGDAEERDDADDSVWHEITLALFWLRALRTIEDPTLPPPPPPSSTSLPQLEKSSPDQGKAAAGSDARTASKPDRNGSTGGARADDDAAKHDPILGFVGFLSRASDADDDQDEDADPSDVPASREKSGSGARASSSYIRFGQAPIRWAWCAASSNPESRPGQATDVQSSTANRSAGKQGPLEEGEWLAFNLAAAAAAAAAATVPPLHSGSAMDAFMGMGNAPAFVGWMPPTSGGGGGGLTGAPGLGMSQSFGMDPLGIGLPMGAASGGGGEALGMPVPMGTGLSMGMGMGMDMGMGMQGSMPMSTLGMSMPMPLAPMPAFQPQPAIMPVGLGMSPQMGPMSGPGIGISAVAMGGLPLTFGAGGNGGGMGGVGGGGPGGMVGMLDSVAGFMGSQPMSAPPGASAVPLA
ncbi:hypothetical protein V8E36_002845 [Tilletia maclaganii]